MFPDGKRGLLIADIQDQRIRRLDLDTGIVNPVAGNGRKNAAATETSSRSKFFGFQSCVSRRKGNMYVAEREGNGVPGKLILMVS
ncbi:MAG: hypothetical protein Ct9H300mP11_32340 [Chloroflexota bacterium]|nr:MAG: hypothetical protein Ct9H300mP11_32340 [Chloroflexota bacterium]